MDFSVFSEVLSSDGRRRGTAETIKKITQNIYQIHIIWLYLAQRKGVVCQFYVNPTIYFSFHKIFGDIKLLYR